MGAAAAPFDSILSNTPVEAILRYGWTRIWNFALADFIIQVLLTSVFMILAAYLNGHNTLTCWRTDGSCLGQNVDLEIHVSACVGLAIWVLQCSLELLSISSFVRYGWCADYFSILHQGHVVLLCLALDGYILASFAVRGRSFISVFAFRFMFAVCCFARWTWVLWSITPQRRFGKGIMPLLYTLLDVEAFASILLLFICAFATCMVALDLRIDNSEHWYDIAKHAWTFALIGEFDGAMQYDRDTQVERFTVKGLLAITQFLLSITLMNVFIASLTSSYATATQFAGSLFHHRLAHAVFKHMTTQHAVRRLLGRPVTPTDQKRLWFSVEADNTLAQQAIRRQ